MGQELIGFDPKWRLEIAAGGIVLRSEYQLRYLTGDLITAMAPLLDGSRTASDLAQCLAPQFEADRVHAAVAHLNDQGYLKTHSPRLQANLAGIEVLVTSASVPGEMTANALTALGALGGQGCGLRIVVTDDYLSPILNTVNREALKTKTPWMLVRPTGRLHWIGPVFRPDRGPCWRCLATTLEANGHVAAAFSPGGFATSAAITETLAAQEAMRWLRSGDAGTALDGRLLEFDHESLTLRSHFVRQLPGCPACGRALDRGPIVLEDLVSPATGIVMSVEWVHRSAHFAVCTATMSQALRQDGSGSLLYAERGLVYGSGESLDEATKSCLGEAVERYSAQFHGDEPRIRSTLSELGSVAIDPAALLLFSDSQHQSGEAPRRFDAYEVTDWTPVRCLSTGRTLYAPTAYCYYGYGFDSCGADSNGCAAAPEWDAAVTTGMIELIERDAVAMWWFNRVQRPALSLEAASARIRRVCKLLESRLGRLFLLDLTHDLETPVCVAVGIRSQAEVFLGSGAGISMETAAWPAVREMASNALVPQGEAVMQFESWLEPSSVSSTGLRSRRQEEARAADVRGCLTRMLARKGYPTYVLDLTRADIGIPVARVLCPGLRPWSRRLAPGRLYEVPVREGWISDPRKEADLNSLAFPL